RPRRPVPPVRHGPAPVLGRVIAPSPPTDAVPPGPGRRRGPADDDPSNPWMANRWMEERLARLAGTAPDGAAGGTDRGVDRVGGGPVLDVGCGRGYWLWRMVRTGLAPVGIEYDPVRAAEAGRQAPVAAGDAA